jgi:hypothetical protein
MKKQQLFGAWQGFNSVSKFNVRSHFALTHGLDQSSPYDSAPEAHPPLEPKAHQPLAEAESTHRLIGSMTHRLQLMGFCRDV